MMAQKNVLFHVEHHRGQQDLPCFPEARPRGERLQGVSITHKEGSYKNMDGFTLTHNIKAPPQ